MDAIHGAALLHSSTSRIACFAPVATAASIRWRSASLGRISTAGRSRIVASSGAVSKPGDEGSTDREESLTLPERINQFRDAFWRFLRPHTVRGTILGSISLVSRALLEHPSLINWCLLPKALRGLLALICGNGYIVGINQIYDVGIDKVNKPFLPIAAGDLSVTTAWFLVLALAGTGIVLATEFGPLITGLYCLGLFLGAIYSVPPLRLKQYAAPAFMIIATVRGLLLNFGVYYATRASLGLKQFAWSPAVIFITFFVTMFATVIAITKDLPDVEGDKKYKISTFATELGVRNIALLGSGLLLANYAAAIVAACYYPQIFRRVPMIAGHTLLACGMVYQLWLLDRGKYSKAAIDAFYRFIWNLFYAEYLLFPMI